MNEFDPYSCKIYESDPVSCIVLQEVCLYQPSMKRWPKAEWHSRREMAVPLVGLCQWVMTNDLYYVAGFITVEKGKACSSTPWDPNCEPTKPGAQVTNDSDTASFVSSEVNASVA